MLVNLVKVDSNTNIFGKISGGVNVTFKRSMLKKNQQRFSTLISMSRNQKNCVIIMYRNNNFPDPFLSSGKILQI